MIRHITHPRETKLQRGTFDEFLVWFDALTQYQLDIESDITNWWETRKLISLQFGTVESNLDDQWFLQWSALSPEQQQILIDRLNNDRRLKFCHNGKYEYIVLRFYGIILENIFDTMNAEKIICGGIEIGEYSLADISWKYLRLMMDKTEQENFGDDIMDDKKIIYGCTDVKYLGIIKRQQIEIAEELGLLNVLGLEMDVMPAFSDTTYEGMILDVDRWRENARLAGPIVDAAKGVMDAWLTQPSFYSSAIKYEYISDKDRVEINFNSHDQKREILQKVFPGIIGGTKINIKTHISKNGMNLPSYLLSILIDVSKGDNKELEAHVVEHHREWLISKGWLIPANEPTINWNSTDQALPLMQLVEPRLKSLDEESINKTTHKALRDLQAYRKSLKLIGQYGESFIHKHCSPIDGRVRTNFNQIVSTGRCSSSDPNMQNISVGDTVANKEDPSGLRYRNSFLCDPDWLFVDGDYISQELIIIAHISKDPVWMECIEKGWDLHSVCAELIHKAKWKNAASEGCMYYEMIVNSDGKLEQRKAKCKCKGHKSLRDGIKSINFGLAYGMSEFKLAGELQITIPEARKLIDQYFATFSGIGRVLNFYGRFGVENGYIMTLHPFKRHRRFKDWLGVKSYIRPYLDVGLRVTALGEIERASKNHPIQGTSADIVKTAMVVIRSYIRDNNLRDKVKFQAQVHDQITTIARKDYAEEWKKILDELMCEAGKLVIPSGILRADVQISPYWTK